MANQFFNAAYYLAQNPDVALAGFTLATAEQHYLKFGANEGRAPNPYFDATQYLLSYPDLIAAGVTKATALQHYAQFGINEGRQPSTAVIPADFSYSAYATANADLRTAFGITDPANLTAAQQHSLLAHFLSYGYVEARPGVVAVNGDTYFTTLSASTSIAVNGVGPFNGSTGNDNFTVATGASIAGGTINGFGGTDTLTYSGLGATAGIVTLNSVEKLVVTATGAADITIAGGATGLSSIAVTNAANTFVYNGAKVDSFALNATATVAGTGSVSANFTSGVTGTADALKLSVGNNHTGAFTATGIETYNVDFGTTLASGVALHANAVNGAALTATLTGGLKGIASTFTIDSLGSGDLATITVDGSAAVGNQTITVLSNVNSTVTGGAGNDVLTGGALDLNHTSTLVGGAGTDRLVSSAGIDTLTGGADSDTFTFAVDTAHAKIGSAVVGGVTTAGQILATDTVTDFASGETLAYTAGTVAAAGSVNAAVGTVSALGGVLTFATGVSAGQSLTQLVTLIEGTGAAVIGSNLLFKSGTDTYFLHVGAGATLADQVAASDIIKLTGVDTTKASIDGAGVHLAA